MSVIMNINICHKYISYRVENKLDNKWSISFVNLWSASFLKLTKLVVSESIEMIIGQISILM